jgi:hypothetical protein
MTGPRCRRPLPVAVAIVLLLAVAGVTLARISQPASDPDIGEAEQDSSGATVASRPSSNGDGAPVDAPRDEAGAVAAAIAYTSASQEWLYLSDDEIRRAVSDIATSDAADRLASEVVDEVRTSRDQLAEASGRVWWLVHPLAWRVESFARDEATVAVWTMTLLSASEVAVPQTAWMTVTVDLAWFNGAWRVDAVRDRPGPTPMTGPRDEPWDARPFDEALAEFTRLPWERDT